ncbi:MAG TPA: hypothetical protein VGK48_17380 [Terriglobia bacterium]
MLRLRRIATGFALAAMIAAAAIYVVPPPDNSPKSLPERFSDEEFWKIVTNFSENGGYFRSDNFISNESTFQWVVPDLSKNRKQGGVYLGVGPDQNFTYIVALHPAVAFITDIRRQNMLLHLMYKVLFEMSADRAEFLSKLFGRHIPAVVNDSDDLETMLKAFNAEKADQTLARNTFIAMMGRLREGHHFLLTPEDAGSIDYVYKAFVAGGPEIRYSFPNQYAWRRFPSYSELMLETDSSGESHSYMASEENFQTMKKLESENRIIPIVGDFAGDKALRSVAKYLKRHGAPVTAFYTSNVEFYLFQSDDWRKYLSNVSKLPLERDSVFIRAYFNNYGPPYTKASNSRSETLVDGMQDLVAAFKAGQIHSYFDVIKRSTAP